MAYPFSEIDQKWQEYWRSHKTFHVEPDSAKKKYFVMDMFAYPSGAGLHMGHVHYAAADIMMRMKRMQGYNALHPTGWDAFGLPAEQYAVRNKLHPRITTEQNIATFRRQLESLGLAYDWDREINTTDPNYFKWTQWIFLKFYNSYFDTNEQKARPIDALIRHIESHGTDGTRGTDALPCATRSEKQFTPAEWKQASAKQRADFLAQCRLAYVAEAPVNWCPELGTVLANEEVAEQEEKGFTVVRRNMRQWMLRITAYAERLLADLDGLNWPASTLEMQRNWIGKSEGAEIDFPIAGLDASLRVFTTRPDTLFGATYMVVAPEHPLVSRITTRDHQAAVEHYLDEVRRKSDLERMDLSREKTGVFTGAYAKNPVNGERTPIWIADYVLMSYGTGAIMSVPGHDERDFEFAQAFGLPVVRVVQAPGVDGDEPLLKAFSEYGVAVNSGFLSELPTSEAKEKMIAWLEANKVGRRAIKYKLRDWLFSRQRYWGEPFPIIWTDDGDGGYAKALPESMLPVLLPEVRSYSPSGTGESPLATISEWVNTTDPETGRPARRETNTMPQWAGSSWYYLRYLDPANDYAPVSRDNEQYWMPVDLYIGGTEHAVTHLLYSRFWHKLLFDHGVVSSSEPFKRMVHQGIVLGENGVKMSKSLGNVLNPDDFLSKYGADTLRTYYMFLGPFEAMKPWDSKGIMGVHRFLNRIWRIAVGEDGVTDLARISGEAPTGSLERTMHRTIKKVGEDIDALQLNTAVSALMILLNKIEEEPAVPRPAFEALIKLVSPFAPHIAEELWQRLGHEGTIFNSSWPEYDDAKTIEDSVTLILQVNGKLRDKLEVPRGLTREALETFARESEKLKRHVDGKQIQKMIVVPDKLVNVVVA
ncbi:MAG: leucine--tRNA ligase [Bacteroidota bacterium]|nr:leucine--tRNA ligase [Bacteroidota bacterium]MDP4232335.1 leucine--tRNA ligase [Bacteroidota bacterium]MDP4241474.1 leucine--tRNA ligase [Bacteroidota bacterium]MDP4286702.1 leucine--tRNA ligase [Bacteroidota bacterium]